MKNQTTAIKIKRARIIFLFFSILTTLSVIYCVLHPRGRYIFITLLFVLCWIISLCNMRSKKGPSFPAILYPVIIGTILFLGYLTPIVFFFEYFFATRWPWEYEQEIAPYREIENNIPYFPDKLPENASDVKFVIVPTYMQAKGYLTLSFVADDAYIQQCINNHRTQFETFNNLQGLYDSDRDELYKSACVDLYSVFTEGYYDETFQEYCKTFSVSELEASEQILDLPQGINLTLEELETATQYHVDLFNGQHGFIIVKSTNRIIFYRDYESM